MYLIFKFFSSILLRVYYFVTVKGKNVDEYSTDIVHPTILDFNSVMSSFLDVNKQK